MEELTRNPVPLIIILGNVLLDKTVRCAKDELINVDSKDIKKMSEESHVPFFTFKVKRVDIDLGRDGLVTFVSYDNKVYQFATSMSIEILPNL